jgi:2-oxo-3-hexenedioate decarboxylase
MSIDPRVLQGLREQLASWRAELKGGARRVGWKIGLNVPEIQEALGIDEPVIGYLTTATLLEPGGEYFGRDALQLNVEAEIALEIGRDVPASVDPQDAREAIAGIAAAIELADVGGPRGDVQAIVAGNVFHRGVVLGESRPAFPAEGVAATIAVNGEERAAADAPDEFDEVVEVTARLLGAAGEQLRAGDRIIAGSITTPVAVRPGDAVTVDLGPLGSLDVRISD